jgi:hypothetical protein
MGEAKDVAMLTTMRSIGLGRILEVEIPMSSTRGVGPHSATKAMFDALERSLDYQISLALDFNILEPLPPSAILRVITQGEAEYHDVTTAFRHG